VFLDDNRRVSACVFECAVKTYRKNKKKKEEEEDAGVVVAR
jgi:hypothetical protein